MEKVRVSTVNEEGILQGSKCLKFQVLLDDGEMEALFTELGDVVLGLVSEPAQLDNLLCRKEIFLERYKEYVGFLKRGEVPSEISLRKYFSAALSRSADVFYAVDVRQERYLLKGIQPVIQMQAHHFLYSSVDGKFHPLVMGKESITWGLQFSYPQIVQDPKTKAIQKVDPNAPNSILFSKVSKWFREYTRPTPFVIGDAVKHEPIRIGKHCFSWIGKHPQLISKGITVRGRHGN